MAKTPRTGPAADETEPELPQSEQVTYIPQEGDPAATKWHGIVFHANVPKTINKPALIEMARGNRFFKVGEFDPQKDVGHVLDTSVADPKTSNEYRAHVVDWVKKSTDINNFIAKWKSEEQMRVACDVGSDDYSFLGQFLRPKMHELAKIAGLNDQALSQAWMNAGIFQLPF